MIKDSIYGTLKKITKDKSYSRELGEIMHLPDRYIIATNDLPWILTTQQIDLLEEKKYINVWTPGAPYGKEKLEYEAFVTPKGLEYMEKVEKDHFKDIKLPVFALGISLLSLVFSIYSLFFSS